MPVIINKGRQGFSTAGPRPAPPQTPGIVQQALEFARNLERAARAATQLKAAGGKGSTGKQEGINYGKLEDLMINAVKRYGSTGGKATTASDMKSEDM